MLSPPGTEKHSAVVGGDGFGGLSTACCLADAGVDVTLEFHEARTIAQIADCYVSDRRR